jgi:uncharacterized protein (DUF433 family)
LRNICALKNCAGAKSIPKRPAARPASDCSRNYVPELSDTVVDLARSTLCPTLTCVSQSVVKVDPEIMSGAPCFAGTRVPIQNLIDHLEGGDSIDEFLEDFPSVAREQVISFLER